MRTVVPLALFTAFAVAVVAAPVPKEKAENLGPITDEQLAESKNNLKQIGLAMHNYESAMGVFPNNIADKNGKLLLSWRVAILPYIEQDALYKQFKLGEAWDSETNKKLIEQMPKLYAPIRAKPKEKGVTFYRGFTGTGAAFEGGRKNNIAGFADGLSNTVLVAEADEPCVWTKPDDLQFDVKKDLPKFGGLFDGEFHLLFGDGSVRRAKAKFDEPTLKAMITRNGGEVTSPDGVFDK